MSRRKRNGEGDEGATAEQMEANGEGIDGDTAHHAPPPTNLRQWRRSLVICARRLSWRRISRCLSPLPRRYLGRGRAGFAQSLLDHGRAPHRCQPPLAALRSPPAAPLEAHRPPLASFFSSVRGDGKNEIGQQQGGRVHLQGVY